MNSDIFKRSHRHEHFEPDYYDCAYAAFCDINLTMMLDLEQHQTVTRRYLLEANYTTVEDLK